MESSYEPKCVMLRAVLSLSENFFSPRSDTSFSKRYVKMKQIRLHPKGVFRSRQASQQFFSVVSERSRLFLKCVSKFDAKQFEKSSNKHARGHEVQRKPVKGNKSEESNLLFAVLSLFFCSSGK